MIQGTVNAAYEAVVSLPLRGPAGRARDVDAVVDTGFTRFLTLPPAMVADLGLAVQRRQQREPSRRQRNCT